MEHREGLTESFGSMSDGLARLDRLQWELCGAALRELGAEESLLDDDEKSALDKDGFVVIPDILTSDQLRAINEGIDAIIERAWQRSGGKLPENADPKCVIYEYETVIKDMANRGPAFDIGFSHPKILAAVAYVLKGNMKLSYLHMREPSAGEGHQELHLDTYEDPVVHPDHYFCNTIWMLDDFTEENGPTRFVPGTHTSGLQPGDTMVSALDRHSDEVLALGKAGSVIVFDGHVWHGGTGNKGTGRRRGLFAAWVHRGFFQIDDQRKFLRPDTYARLSDPARYLLDVHGAAPVQAPED